MITAKKIDLKGIVLIDHMGQKHVDLKNICVDFSIYEDILSPYITADMTLSDATGLIETLPIIGEETVIIKFRSFGEEELEYSTYNFVVDGPSSRSKTEERLETYVVHMISPEAVVNTMTESTAGYVGKTIKNIVETEYERHFTNSNLVFGIKDDPYLTQKPPGIVVGDTDGLHSFVAPSSTAFEFIKQLTHQAASKDYKESDFVFYRNRDEYRFETFSELMTKDAVETYTYADPDVEKNNPKPGLKNTESHQIIYHVEYKSLPSTSDRIAAGMIETQTIAFDPVLKTFTTSDFRYARDFSKQGFTGLGGYSVKGPLSVHEDSNKPIFHSRMFAVDSKKSEVSYMEDKENDNNIDFPKTRQNFSDIQTSKMAQIKQGTRLALTIPGANNRTVGEVINILLPQNATHSALNTRYNILFTKNAQDSRFLITALVHNYNAAEAEYYTRIEVIKETYANPISKANAILNEGDDWS
jgi:hypothetical protein